MGLVGLKVLQGASDRARHRCHEQVPLCVAAVHAVKHSYGSLAVARVTAARELRVSAQRCCPLGPRALDTNSCMSYCIDCTQWPICVSGRGPATMMLLHPLLHADASRKQSLLTPEEEDDVADDEDATLSGDGADDGGGSGGHGSIPAASVIPLFNVCAIQVRCRPITAFTTPANFGTAAY